jgi:UDPglucose--hexose-1-phosphate uridylyltransferase
MTPAEVWRLADDAGRWKVRVVPNLFPLVDPDARTQREGDASGCLTMAGVGRHEVLIESPDHDWDLSTATTDEARDVVLAYRDRYLALREDRPALIAVFRNHGQASGTSLAHPHSQLVAMPVVPALTQRRLDIARRHFDETGRCLYVDLLARELAGGGRILIEDESFVAYQPFAASAPFETWIVPRQAQASFAELTDEAALVLARILRDLLKALRLLLDDPPYNLVISSVPPADEGTRYFLWHLKVLPRITIPAGLELETGIAVNTSLPETTAEEVRQVLDRVRRLSR